MQQKTWPLYELEGEIGYRETGWGVVVSTHDRFYSRNGRGLPTPAVTSRLMEKFEAIGQRAVSFSGLAEKVRHAYDAAAHHRARRRGE